MNESDRDDLLIRLDERVEAILRRLEEGDVCMKDMDKRLDKVETFQAVVIGVSATVSIILTMLVNWIRLFFFGGN